MAAERWFEQETGATPEPSLRSGTEPSLRSGTEPSLRSGTEPSALCRDGTGEMVTLFFSEQLDDIARAKAICGQCPVREACFEQALVRREPYGVWGGHLFFKGRVLAMKRGRGRPPKAPRTLSA